MIEKIYTQLKVPKTPEEIQLRFTEIGLNWNIHQIELFLDMDKNIECNDLVTLNSRLVVVSTYNNLFNFSSL
jgi:hypothetical protein